MKTKNNILIILFFVSFGLLAQGKKMLEKKEEIFGQFTMLLKTNNLN